MTARCPQIPRVPRNPSSIDVYTSYVSWRKVVAIVEIQCRIGRADRDIWPAKERNRAVGEGLDQRPRRQADRGLGQSVEGIVSKALAEIGIGIAARQRVAELVANSIAPTSEAADYTPLIRLRPIED